MGAQPASLRANSSRVSWAAPLLPVGLAVFLMAGLTYYHLEVQGSGVATEGPFQGLVALVYDLLGFVPGFMVCLLLLVWSSIWFISGSTRRPWNRLLRILTFGLSLALVVSMSRDDAHAVQNGGLIGHFLATRLVSVFGYAASTLLAAAVALATVLLATDFFFFRYFDALSRDVHGLPPRPAKRPMDSGVETEAVEQLRTLRFPEGDAGEQAREESGESTTPLRKHITILEDPPDLADWDPPATVPEPQSQVAADEVAADEVAADEVAADEVAADVVAADVVAADVVAADVVAADEVATEEEGLEEEAAEEEDLEEEDLEEEDLEEEDLEEEDSQEEALEEVERPAVMEASLRPEAASGPPAEARDGAEEGPLAEVLEVSDEEEQAAWAEAEEEEELEDEEELEEEQPAAEAGAEEDEEEDEEGEEEEEAEEPDHDEGPLVEVSTEGGSRQGQLFMTAPMDVDADTDGETDGETDTDAAIDSGADTDTDAVPEPVPEPVPVPEPEPEPELAVQALEVLLQARRASASLLQRRLEVTFGKAVELLDFLREQGMVGGEPGEATGKLLTTTGPDRTAVEDDRESAAEA